MAAIAGDDRIVMIERRLFRDDNTRIFVGVVEAVDGDAVRSRGFLFHLSPYEVSGSERRGDERVRILSLSAGDIIYLMPHEVDFDKLQLKRSPKSMMLTDGKFSMDLSDFMLRV